MSYYNPKFPFNVPFELLIPTDKKEYGVHTKTYPESGDMFWATVRTGSTYSRSQNGSERTFNEILSILELLTITTWYRPDITSKCAVKRVEDGTVFEIITDIEKINGRTQFIQFKAKAIRGET